MTQEAAKKEALTAIVWQYTPSGLTDRQFDNRGKKLAAIDAQIKELEKQRDMIRDEIITGMNGATEYETAAFRFFFKTIKSSRFDSKAFKAAQPETYTAYCKESSTQRFTYTAI